jgi:hypothetical protein
MGISAYKSMTKQELALSQLNVAVRLYLQDEEYPAAITLAGAAEEILGKIAMSMGHVPSFKRKVRDLCEMFQAIWGREANEKDFADLRNRARNELKHIGNGEPPLISQTPKSEDNPRTEVFDAEASAVHSGVQARSSSVAQGGRSACCGSGARAGYPAQPALQVGAGSG